jgi:hypothetical protein
VQHAAFDLVADGAHVGDVESGGVVEGPFLVAFAGEHGAGVPAAHADHDVRGTDDFVGPWLGGLLRCCEQTVLALVSPAVCYLSEGQDKLVKRDADPILHGQVGGDRVVAAAQILHEGMSGGDGARGRQAFESAHRP